MTTILLTELQTEIVIEALRTRDLLVQRIPELEEVIQAESMRAIVKRINLWHPVTVEKMITIKKESGTMTLSIIIFDTPDEAADSVVERIKSMESAEIYMQKGMAELVKSKLNPDWGASH